MSTISISTTIREASRCLFLTILQLGLICLKSVLRTVKERVEGLYFVRRTTKLRIYKDRDGDSQEDIFENIEDIGEESVIENDNEEIEITDNESEEDMAELLFLQDTKCCQVSVCIVTPLDLPFYVSERALDSLSPEETENATVCTCLLCRDEQGELHVQSWIARLAYRGLNCLHLLSQPLLSMAGWYSELSYVVRRVWLEDGVYFSLLQNTRTGELVSTRRLMTLVSPEEDVLDRLVSYISSEESHATADIDSFKCPGVHCKVSRAVRSVGVEVVPECMDLDMFDICTGTVTSLDRKEMVVTCTVCLAVLEDGQQEARLRCGHSFHRECVGHWILEGNRSCPVCRAEVKHKLEHK